MNAKDLQEYLLLSDNPEIQSLGHELKKIRSEAFDKCKDQESNLSSVYWQKHKITVSLYTDLDFYIYCPETRELEFQLSHEWVGDTKEEVINKASAYMMDLNNYSDSFQANTQYFIENYLKEGFCKMLNSEETYFGSAGNWDLDVNYEAPEHEPSQKGELKPKINIFGNAVDLFDASELSELGFNE